MKVTVKEDGKLCVTAPQTFTQVNWEGPFNPPGQRVKVTRTYQGTVELVINIPGVMSQVGCRALVNKSKKAGAMAQDIQARAHSVTVARVES